MKFASTTRPVGQVVKTAASHAVNIGSNPVRVTSQNEARGVPFPPDGENCTLLPPFFLPHEAGFMRVNGGKFLGEQKVLDKRSGFW